jgi:predicted nucleotidyltransferase
MTVTTKMEKEIALKLFKDFTNHYNPASIAKAIGKSRVGTFKALKTLEKENITKGEKLGKATFYKLNLKDEYTRKNIELLLIEEARKKQRWLDEFKELFEFTEIAIIFGSITRNESKASDIDILLILKPENNKKVNRIIETKSKILPKRIHPIKQTKEDLAKNIRKKDKTIINALKEGIVLHGHEKLTTLIKNATDR